MLLLTNLTSANLTSANLTLINSRGIATRVRAVATKITKSMTNAQVKGTILESKGKAMAAEAIKAKAAQAATTLKLPKEHLYWSFWLIGNAFQALVKGYNIWLTNMNKYWIFRIVSALIGYVLLPVRIAIQLLSYLRMARLAYAFVAFILGLITDFNVVHNDFAGISDYLVIQLHSIAINISTRFRDLSDWIGNSVMNNNIQDKVAMQKAIALPGPDQIVLENAEERTWLQRHSWDIFAGVSIVILAGVVYYLYFHTGGDTPPVEPAQIIPAINPVEPINPVPVIPEAGQGGPGQYWTNFNNTIRNLRLEASEMYEMVRNGDWRAFTDIYNRARVEELQQELAEKLAAAASENSKVDNNLLGPLGISPISGPSTSGVSSAVSSPASDTTVLPDITLNSLVSSPASGTTVLPDTSVLSDTAVLSDTSALVRPSTPVNSGLLTPDSSPSVVKASSRSIFESSNDSTRLFNFSRRTPYSTVDSESLTNLNPNASTTSLTSSDSSLSQLSIPRTPSNFIDTRIGSDRIVEINSDNEYQYTPWGRESLRNKTSKLNPNGNLSVIDIILNGFNKVKYPLLFNIYDLCDDKRNNRYIILFYNDEMYKDNKSFFQSLWSSITRLQLVKDIPFLKFEVELTNGGNDYITIHKTYQLKDNCEFFDYYYRLNNLIFDINNLSNYNFIKVYIYYNKEITSYS